MYLTLILTATAFVLGAEIQKRKCKQVVKDCHDTINFFKRSSDACQDSLIKVYQDQNNFLEELFKTYEHQNNTAAGRRTKNVSAKRPSLVGRLPNRQSDRERTGKNILL